MKGQRTNENIKNAPLDPIVKVNENKLGLKESMKTSETDGNLTIPSVSFGEVDGNHLELNIFTSFGQFVKLSVDVSKKSWEVKS